MDLLSLRRIGKILRKNLISEGSNLFRRDIVGIGAAGDQAYRIDVLAEETIFGELNDLREPCTVISEETGVLDLRGGGRIVIVDPIDGSKNAVAGIPFFSTSIAIADGGQTFGDLLTSYIINLANGDEFWAERHKGAFFNGVRMVRQTTDSVKIVAFECPSPKTDLSRIQGLLQQSPKIRCLGSTSLALAHLAKGAISVFITAAPSRSFDFAGGWHLIKEAGGIVTDMDGKPLDELPLSISTKSSLVASMNPEIHNMTISLLKGGK